MRRKATLLTIIVIALCILLMNCKEDNVGISNLARLDIANATGLAIAPVAVSGSDAGGGATTSINVLYKVTDVGTLEEVTYLNSEGETVSLGTNPVSLYDASNEYAIIGFGTDSTIVEDGYLVAKDSGYVYSLEGAGYPVKQANSFSRSNPNVQTDANGNMYYLSLSDDNTRNEVTKIDVSDPNNVIAVAYTPTTDDVAGFVVDANGSAVYYGGASSRSIDASTFRIAMPNGSFYNITEDTLMSPFIWTSSDDSKLYYWGHQDIESGLNFIREVTIDSSFNISLSIYADQVSLGGSIISSDHEVDYSCFRIDDRTFAIITMDGANSTELYNLYNTDRTVNVLATPVSTYVENESDMHVGITISSTVSDNYIYMYGYDSGDPMLIRVDPTYSMTECTEEINQTVCYPEYTTLLDTDEYEIYKMYVDDDENITFNGLRFSDGAIIIGTIDPSGNISVIDATLNSEVVVLERL